MQFHHSTPPQNVRIRRIPTIRLQTMKHVRGNCMRNCEGGGAKPPRKVARNSIEQSFNKVRKRCNSNDLNSMFEIVAGELRAKLGMASAMPQARVEHDTRAVGHGCGARGRWRGLAGLRGDAPSEARSADGSRAGRRPPAHTAAGPSGARNTRGATSNQPSNASNASNATMQRKRAAAQRAAARSRN